jgi:hypothetical protein
MPDTGAPWNIPYVAPSDLVRDYPSDSEDLADAIAAGLSAAGNPGIGSNVVQTVKTDTFTMSSGTYTDITGLTATITPTTATSKILLLAQVNISQQNATAGGGFAIRFSGGDSDDYVGDTEGSRITSATGNYWTNFVSDTNVNNWASGVIIYLDSPATTSATTYSVQVRQATAGTVYVNRGQSDSNIATNQRGASSLTVIEVAV